MIAYCVNLNVPEGFIPILVHISFQFLHAAVKNLDRKHWVVISSKASDRSERALSSGKECRWMELIDSEMAGPIKLKLGGMVEGMGENVLAKKFF